MRVESVRYSRLIYDLKNALSSILMFYWRTINHNSIITRKLPNKTTAIIHQHASRLWANQTHRLSTGGKFTICFKLISKRFIKVSQTGLVLELWKKWQKGGERGESLNSFRRAFQSRSCEAALRRGAHAQDARAGARGGRAAGDPYLAVRGCDSKFLSYSIRFNTHQRFSEHRTEEGAINFP